MFNRTFIPLSIKGARFFHAGKPKQALSFLDADANKTVHKLYHKSAYALAFLAPIAVLLSPSPFSFPIDLTLGLVIPYHSHVGLDQVIKDYVPKAFKTGARVSLLVVSSMTVVGLLKLNLAGPGLTQTVKSLWYPVKQEE